MGGGTSFGLLPSDQFSPTSIGSTASSAKITSVNTNSTARYATTSFSLESFILLTLTLFCPVLYSQRIIFQSDFENITLNSDSLPANWVRFDVDHNNPSIKWAVRDTSVNFGGNTRPKAHNSAKSLEIPWYAGSGGNNINDDWVFTDSFTVQQGDSLIFWMLIGSDTTFSAYLDSMQVWIAILNQPGGAVIKLATIISNRDSLGHALNNNEWTIHKFSLNSVIGYQIYLAFRYYMDISLDGLWCNIDDIFIIYGNAVRIVKNNDAISADIRIINDIKDADYLVKKGDAANLILVRRGISIELYGKAMNDGKLGDIISVELKLMNSSRTKLVKGKVSARNQIEVDL